MKQATKYNFTVVYEKQKNGGYVVSVPALPGCYTEGRTFEEAQKMAAEAIRSYVGSLIKHGESVPIDTFKNQFVGNLEVKVAV